MTNYYFKWEAEQEKMNEAVIEEHRYHRGIEFPNPDCGMCEEESKTLIDNILHVPGDK